MNCFVRDLCCFTDGTLGFEVFVSNLGSFADENEFGAGLHRVREQEKEAYLLHIGKPLSFVW
jgi:hypothetical protein